MITSINGRIGLHEISVLDRGLLFGESVYERIPIYHGQAYQLDAHMTRLTNSFSKLNIPPINIDLLDTWVQEFMDQIPIKESTSMYIQVTSGTLPSHRTHVAAEPLTPNVMLHEIPFHPICTKTYQLGFTALCVPDQRSGLCATKTTQLSLNTQALYTAKQQGYDDALFVRGEHVVEAASSNLFAVIKNTLITPPLNGIVPGVTRMKVLEFAHQANIPTQVRPIHINELAHASEIFLTSSIKQLKPIIEVKSHFKQASTGPIWKQLLKAYQQDIIYAHEHHTIDH